MRRRRKCTAYSEVEGFESRVMLAYSLGTNLVVNPSAESGLAGWASQNGSMTTQAYGGVDLPATGGSPSNFFWGGNSATSTISQNISLSGGEDEIDLGLARANLSAWLGGYDAQNDRTLVQIQWLNGSGSLLRADDLGTVTNADRGNVTSMNFKQFPNIPVPAGSRSVNVVVQAIRAEGVNNDGSADDISLVLSQVSPGANLTEDVTVIGTLNIGLEPTDNLNWAGNVLGAGTVIISGGGNVDIASTNFSPGQLIVNNPGGTVKVKSGATVNTPVTVQQGTLAIDLNGEMSDVGPGTDLLIQQAGKLTGVGAISADVQVSGTLALGSSPGRLTTGDVSFSSTGRFEVEIFGSSAGTGYDQLAVLGTVNLGGGTLTVDRGNFSASAGQEFVIINNNSGDAVVGTFAGLPQGKAFNVNGHRFHIDYFGGNGNDVVLRRNIAPTGSAASKSVDEDTVLNSSVAKSDSDGDSTTVSLVSGPSNEAAFSLNSNGTFSYKGKAHFSGTDSFQYRVNDGEKNSPIYTVTITVDPVTDTPNLSLGNISGAENAWLAVPITSSLVDQDGSETLSIILEGLPAFATLNQGTDQGGGQWLLTPAQLSGLEIQVNDDAQFTLTAKATARETATGATKTNTKSSTVTIGNIVPQLTNLSATTIVENGTTTLTGVIVDPSPLDSFTIDVNWGDPLSPHNIEQYEFSAGTTDFTLTHQYLDDNPTNTSTDDYTIDLTVTDDDTGSTSNSTNVTVNNLAPVLQSIIHDANINEVVAVGDLVTLTGLFTDVGTLDTHSATIDWGDGNVTNAVITETAGSGGLEGTHSYADGGIYTITVTVMDDDTQTDVLTATAFVTGAGVNNGELQIVGSMSHDAVTVTPIPALDQYVISATFLDGNLYRIYSMSAIDQIVILGREGHDVINLGYLTPTPSMIDAGAGHDVVYGAMGPDVIYGGPGIDQIHGFDGDDQIMGGDDNDLIFGGFGNDILFGDAGNDQLFGQGGGDYLDGGIGNDYLYGGMDNDSLIGGLGNDWLYGGWGDDNLNGGGGIDWLFGELGDDSLLEGEYNFQ